MARSQTLRDAGAGWRVVAWEVCNRLEVPTGTRDAAGKCMFIRKTDGAILGTVPYSHTVVY